MCLYKYSYLCSEGLLLSNKNYIVQGWMRTMKTICYGCDDSLYLRWERYCRYKKGRGDGLLHYPSSGRSFICPVKEGRLNKMMTRLGDNPLQNRQVVIFLGTSKTTWQEKWWRNRWSALKALSKDVVIGKRRRRNCSSKALNCVKHRQIVWKIYVEPN